MNVPRDFHIEKKKEKKLPILDSVSKNTIHPVVEINSLLKMVFYP